MSQSFAAFFLLAYGLLGQKLPAQDTKVGRDTTPKREAKEALRDFNVLVGEWRGIGLPRRGSRAGAWSETANCIWDFKDTEQPSLLVTSAKGQLIDKMWLRFDEKTQQFLLDIKLAGSDEPKVRRLRQLATKKSGQKPGAATKIVRAKSKLPPRIQFIEAVGQGETAYRVSVAVLKAKRVTILIERGKTVFRRVAEIGYTRKGESIADRGPSGPECVVTGGAGTIRVSHKGKTYFVCCSGCQQAFDDDPEGVLADYRTRLEEEKKKRTQKP